MTALITLCLIVGNFSLSRGTKINQVDAFIEDIIETLQFRSPTIIVNDEIPNICITYQWLLCLSDDQDDSELSNHLASIHHHRKQDGMIFIGFQGHEKILQQLTDAGSTILTSNYPVFIPITYQNEIGLRLDSNIIFYKNIGIASFQLYDVFAVKGGPSIKVDFGKWNYENRFNLTKSMNRWERRNDLQGTRFLNCFARNLPGSEFIKDKAGNIIGSKGWYQDILFYITDRLNLTIETIEAQWVNKLLDNGSWTGQIGFLQRQEADVVTTSLGITLQRNNFIDFPIQIIYGTLGLAAILPIKGTSPNMWVYIRVFGIYQWMIFIIFLILIVMGLIVIHASSEDQSGREFGTKRGSHKKYRLNTPSSALAMAFLYALQMGSHTNSKQLAPRVLTMTMSMLTLLLFALYTTDITAEMTSGPPEIPINTFEDVIYYGYKVVTGSPPYEHILATSKNGSAMREVYNNNFELKKDIEEAVKSMIETYDYKTLFFGTAGMVIRILEQQGLRKTYQAVDLKMDYSTRRVSGLGLQKDSEFSPVFNYFILKGMENGVLHKIKKADENDPDENFAMSEPQPLGLNNVMFCFISLGFGIALSIIKVMMEYVTENIREKKGVAKTNERGNTARRAISSIT